MSGWGPGNGADVQLYESNQTGDSGPRQDESLVSVFERFAEGGTGFGIDPSGRGSSSFHTFELTSGTLIRSYLSKMSVLRGRGGTGGDMRLS